MNKERLKDMFNFSKVSIIMTLVGYLATIIVFDWLNFSAIYGFWLIVPFTWTIKYILYNKFWRKL